MKPLIGITGDIDERDGKRYLYIDTRYGSLIEEYGGIPLLLHPAESVKEVISKIDGLLLSGGEDIHPKYYGEEPKYPMELSPDIRTEFEIALVKEAMVKGLPILGICHGMQLLNVALGGMLYQDLKRQNFVAKEHQLGDGRHQVFITRGTQFFKIMGRTAINVTSTHHQAVKNIAKGLRVCVRTTDSVIEGFEMPEYPFLIGVQWHPEKEPDEDSRRLFQGFIDQSLGIRTP
ncbi:MAG: gamma-glutamyl-gamma-aminobutyrate hydrolase [Deltaproteobacteria bacterium]|nr:gamma-glutamyl-gamma-aminobutyrate hydrolase [Deltaproteobacteria bacterium]